MLSAMRLPRLALLMLAATWLAPRAPGEPASATAPAEMRFSQTVGTPERPMLGLDRLTPDQIAVLDALIRRDTTLRSRANADASAPEAFSRRLNADELRLAGLDTLPAETMARLDAAIARRQTAILAPFLLSPPVYLARPGKIEAREQKRERELHGTFSLTYGWGKGGYSEKTGAMTVTMEDPDKGYSLSVGYSESHVKGPNGVRFVELPKP